MNRSQFLSAALGIPALFAGGPLASTPRLNNRKITKPKRLRVGDLVSLIAPAGPVDVDRVQQSVRNLESIGLRVKVGDNILAKRGHNAGTDGERLSDFHDAFGHKESRAVWCIRGGDGSYKLLPHIDYELVRDNPKILIGYSDITALLQAQYVETGLVGFHGPIAASSPGDWVNFRSDMEAVIFEGGKNHLIKSSSVTEVIAPGRVEGILAGGNLTLLAALAGTPHGLDATDKLVFLEDVGEAPRRIDRMLTTLKQAAKLHRAHGIILGEFVDCECDLDPDDNTRCAGNSLTLRRVLEDHFSGMGIPVFYNFPFGHGKKLCTFPVGVDARMDTEAGTVELLENAVK